MKRIVTMQDITCLGKCALTVALPIISAMGVEASVIPTAVLSVHTAFDEFTFHDLTPQVSPIVNHWRKEGFTFDAIYTGYLGSFEQLELISQFVDDFKKQDTLVFMDPVLGDHGKLYSGFDLSFAKAMAKLCAKADVITPNLTEACLLLGRPYPGDHYQEDYVKELLCELGTLGAKKVILTGASFHPDEVGVVAYNAETKQFFQYFNKRFPMQFHGTGDVFSSTCVGALTRGFSLEQALTLAVDFTLATIQASLSDPERRWYSVNFEQAIPMLVKRLAEEQGIQP